MAKDGYGSVREDSLFFALAEDLKTPLLRIAYQAELDSSADIQSTATDALKLLDSYLLSLTSQASFELEPVNPSAVLFDVAHDLSAHAKRFDCQLRLHNNVSRVSALLNRQALLAALTAIGTVFIEAQSIVGGKKGIELATYKTEQGIAIGVFHTQDSAGITAQLLTRAREHAGTAARPFAGLASGASAQLFIAERLLQGMQTTLRVARRGEHNGLAADLLLSSQLHLV